MIAKAPFSQLGRLRDCLGKTHRGDLFDKPGPWVLLQFDYESGGNVFCVIEQFHKDYGFINFYEKFDGAIIKKVKIIEDCDMSDIDFTPVDLDSAVPQGIINK